MPVVPLRERFGHTKAGHCGSGSLRDLLAFNGLDFGAGPLSEGMVFGLGGGLGFLYAERDGGFYAVGRASTMEEDFARNLDVGLDYRESDNPAEGWAWVRDGIDAGRPLMIVADMRRLEYLRVSMENTGHRIVVVDYDEDGIWVADNDREELQRVAPESLAAARSSTGFPGDTRHGVFDYDWPASLGDPAAAIRGGVEVAVANMTTGGAPVGSLAGPAGLAGVARFAEVYPDWPQRHGERLQASLSLLRVLIVKAGTGGAMFRSLHAEFLDDAAQLLGDPQLARLARDYDDLAAAWVALATAAGAGDHAGGLEPIATIARLEQAGVAAMRAWLA